MRRLRASESVRAMVAENVVLPENLILPVFLTEGGGNEPIASMPGVERLTVPALVEKCRALLALGVRGIAPFPKTPPEKKTPDGEESANPDCLVCRAIRAVKEAISIMSKMDAGKAAARKAKAAAKEKDEEASEEAPKKRGRKPKKLAESIDNTQVNTPVDINEVMNHYDGLCLGAGYNFDAAKITNYKKVIDGGWQFSRRTPIDVPDVYIDDKGEPHSTYTIDPNTGMKRLNLFTRPLRADTAQGPRVALASSEMVPAGSEFYFKVTLMNPEHKKAFFECMDLKGEIGMCQWRSGEQCRRTRRQSLRHVWIRSSSSSLPRAIREKGRTAILVRRGALCRDLRDRQACAPKRRELPISSWRMDRQD